LLEYSNIHIKRHKERREGRGNCKYKKGKRHKERREGIVNTEKALRHIARQEEIGNSKYRKETKANNKARGNSSAPSVQR
jgi:hypothetical protein